MTRVELHPGFALNAEVTGDGPPLVLLHGFTGSGRAWGSFAALLAARCTVIAVDLVGHGSSDKPRTLAGYAMPRAAADAAELVRRLGWERASWLGYSMGGRTALQVAAAEPDVIEALVLIGGSPGISSAAERDARVVADEALAAQIERDGIEAFVDYWEGMPLFASQARLPAERRAAIRAGRLSCDPAGLANSLRGMGAGVQAPLHDALSALRMPLLAIAGELDRKYIDIGHGIASAVHDGRVLVVPDAGHATQVEQPEATAAAVVRFLKENTRRD